MNHRSQYHSFIEATPHPYAPYALQIFTSLNNCDTVICDINDERQSNLVDTIDILYLKL